MSYIIARHFSGEIKIMIMIIAFPTFAHYIYMSSVISHFKSTERKIINLSCY